MKFNQLCASRFSPARRRNKSFNQGSNLRNTHCMGDLISVVEGKRARRHDWSPAAFLKRNRTASFPWFAGARFSAGVGKLYCGNRTLLLDERKNPAQRLHMRVTP